MMKTEKLFISVTVLLFVLTGCGPKVMTSFVKTYSDTVSPWSVYVLEQGDTLRCNADTLGRVSVVDAGYTSKCKYDYVLGLAKKEVAKVGGNSFLVTTHLTPSLISTCHQISGLALRIDRDSIDYLKSGRTTEASDNPQNSANNRRRNASGISIGAYFGGGWIISDVYTDRGVYSGIGGMDWRFEVESISKHGMGVAIQYSGSKTTPYSGYEMEQIYLGPTFVYKGALKRWFLKVGVGAGYFALKESDKLTKESLETGGFGLNTEFSAEYLLTKHIGLSVGLYMITGFLPDKDNQLLRENHQLPGVKRINFMTGLHYNF